MKDLFKVELHIHLDGSMRPSTVADILNIPLEKVKQKMIAPKQCKDLNDYLTKFDLPVLALQTKENLERAAYELVCDLESDHVIYAEIRFAPLKHTKEGLTLDEVVLSVLNGLKRGKIKTKLILCCMRDDTLENNLKVVELAHKYKGDVVAIDLAGAEAIYKTSSFKSLFDSCQEKNISYTIHAGEADSYDSIQSAIDFKTKRIGHGVLSINYPDLLKEIKEKNILLEICPTSNIQTNMYSNIEEHPIYSFYLKNIPICINTDNRTVSNITLTQEYENLKMFFKKEDFCKMNLNAIEHSFLTEKEKEILKDKIIKQLEQIEK